MKRLILLTAILWTVSSAAHAQCELPAGYDHSTSIVEGNLQTTIGTTDAVFRQGDVIEFVVITTNVGSEAETIDWPVEIPDALFVTPSVCEDIKLCYFDRVYSYPPFFFYVPGSETLAPGECRTRTMTWDTVEDPAEPGVHKAWGGLMAWTTTTFDDPDWGWILPPAILTVQIIEPVSIDDASWGQIKSWYAN